MTRTPKPGAGEYSKISRHVLRPRPARALEPDVAGLVHDEFDHHQVTQKVEAPLGDGWAWALWKENLGRNLAIAGMAAEHGDRMYRLGRADAEVEHLNLAKSRTTTTRHCAHQSTMKFTEVHVCSACLQAVDRIV